MNNQRSYILNQQMNKPERKNEHHRSRIDFSFLRLNAALLFSSLDLYECREKWEFLQKQSHVVDTVRTTWIKKC